MIRGLLFGCALVAAPAAAQTAYPPVDPATVSAAVTAAQPAPCPVPLPDTYVGNAGVQPGCMTRPDATRASVIQATTVTTASDGTFTGSWPVAFANAPTGRSATVEITSASGSPFTCAFVAGSVTATAFSGKCWQIVATTLPTATTSLLGLVVSPLANAAGGQTVRVTGRQ